MATVKIAVLIVDFELYPRTTVDSQHVGRIAEAMRAGVDMPPIIVDKVSKKIIDGVHRYRAAIRVYGEGCTIEVEWRTYKNDKEMFLDAMRLNSAHGRAMNTIDRVHCGHRAVELKIKFDLLASALNMVPKAVERLIEERSAKVGKNGTPVPLKRAIKHLAGHRISKTQRDSIPKIGGNQQTFYVNQLILFIEQGFLNLDNPKLVECLYKLRELLNDLEIPLAEVE